MVMRIKNLLLAAVLLISSAGLSGQTYSILIKGGHVIDPKNKIDAVMDIAIKDGKIALVSKNIDPSAAKQVINAKDMYVTPGLIDIHVHVFYGTRYDQAIMNGVTSVSPDAFSFRAGVTTFVDAGSSGWRYFDEFKKNIIDASQTRVLAFLNIVGEGMRGGPFEQNIKDMDAHKAAEFARGYPGLIVGFKLAHYEGHDWAPTDSTVMAGRIDKLPVMIDFGASDPPLPMEELLMKHLRPGDIYTHCYAYWPKTREAAVDENGKVKPFIKEAQKSGRIFDVGHGGGSFFWSQALPAVRQGFIGDCISSDLHTGSMNSGMKDMCNLMSKFLNMGLTVQDVVYRSTWKPAQVINRTDLGNLSVGSEADIAVLSISKGSYGFLDITGDRLPGDQKLAAELTLRAGKIVWDLNGLAATGNAVK
jgi:dihydroorotase